MSVRTFTTKSYNQQGLGSSYEKASYKSYKPKSKGFTADRWDHSGYDQLQQEKFEKPPRFNNNRKTEASTTPIEEPVKDLPIETPQERVSEASSVPENRDSVKEDSQNSKPKREKRPDRQLYNARQKHSTRNTEVKGAREMTIQCTDRLNFSVIEKKEDASPYPQAVKDVLEAFEDKELLEDDGCSVSNVSTAISERLKTSEEESYIKNETIKDMGDVSEVMLTPKAKESEEVLLDIVLETGEGMISVRIYEGEEDYEGILQHICDTNGFSARMGLYFKINVLNQIKELGADVEKVDALLDKLLEINYKVIMFESGFGDAADDSIALYLDEEVCQDEDFLENLEETL